jgi:hypothetical protein
MSASSPRPTSPSRLAWLLVFGMLFAFAQGVASAHAISHIGQDAGRTRDGGLGHAQCDLCLIGATIGGAAPLPDAPPALPLVHAEVPRDATTCSAPSRRPDRPYQSRAPPLASR